MQRTGTQDDPTSRLQNALCFEAQEVSYATVSNSNFHPPLPWFGQPSHWALPRRDLLLGPRKMMPQGPGGSPSTPPAGPRAELTEHSGRSSRTQRGRHQRGEGGGGPSLGLRHGTASAQQLPGGSQASARHQSHSPETRRGSGPQGSVPSLRFLLFRAPLAHLHREGTHVTMNRVRCLRYGAPGFKLAHVFVLLLYTAWGNLESSPHPRLANVFCALSGFSWKSLLCRLPRWQISI